MVHLTRVRLVVVTAVISCGLTAALLFTYSPHFLLSRQNFKVNAQYNALSVIVQTVTPRSELSILTEVLKEKMRDAASIPDLNVKSKTCKEMGIVNYKEPDCPPNKDNCLRTSIPKDLSSRLEELTVLRYLSVPEKYRDVLRDLRSHVPGQYDFLITTGISSNHFDEGQAQLKNYHEVMFPHLKNFSMIVYDLGLNKKQRQDLEKYCRCTVISFPFDQLPQYFRNLKCFAWKLFILAAHLEQTEVLFWGDTSVRIKNGTAVNDVIARTKLRGVQQHGSKSRTPNPYHTKPTLFESFGDSPCVHMPFRQIAGGFLFYHREPLIQKAVMEPLLACSLNAKCICPPNQKALQNCGRIPPKTVGICNRNDQSVMTLVLSRLYREKYHYVAVNLMWFAGVHRENKAKYFEELRRKSANQSSTTTKPL